MSLQALYKKNISLSEWFEAVGHTHAELFRKEDGDKSTRLTILHDTIGMSYEKPTIFPLAAVLDNSKEFQLFYQEKKQTLCAFRLVPKDPSLPKLRMRGETVASTLTWLHSQHIDPSAYVLHIVPHPTKTDWSSIVIINTHGIFGEVIRGGHSQLTTGIYEYEPPVAFSHDFFSLTLHRHDAEAKKHIETILSSVLVPNLETQQQLAHTLHATFSEGYLNGYFETVTSPDYGLWFIDYNRLLGKQYLQTQKKDAKETVPLSGEIAYPGKVEGSVAVVMESESDIPTILDGDILVCPMTHPGYLLLMQQAKGIITDQGGILSHAAIVSRELHIPCLVGTRTATTTLKHGDQIILDATTGNITTL
ncbi:MAG: hypothetical protein COU33_00610 [Candidatus Magasanikbacteria bacterium CG10_big_fil_rev_8_21_14_0_10_43_6]|uniref:PEP-utilising enzyme mobile domain-containing protein n=1 Tax=Candidatus Magasanikbacteria bacterium CG10_big_fil_rev_8_21_14_0_10_43_6 TaxID=1974650 RepID=A0A2M6W272_9BACT|nr:MAG: hypothetical protein COU33_00610 [Candidatus Magasanikbacteria bacterium CG10_big_fil_rev_8_21_14_0_10_43_6]